MKTIINFFKNLFSSQPESSPVPTGKQFHLGAFLNEPDNRDIPYTSVVGVTAPVVTPQITVPNFLNTTRLEQGSLGTCVEHALEFIRRNDDGILHSRRVPYALTRQYLNWGESQGQGLPQREAAKINTTVGTPKDSGLDDNTLPHPVYAGLAITQAMRDEANIYRFGGFAFPQINLAGLQQALQNGKCIAVTIAIDWGAIDPDGTVHVAKNVAGFHEVVIGQYDNNTRKFRFANWWGSGWGTNGDGFITYAELEHVIFDAIVFTEIPEDLKERAKQTQFIFTTPLSSGMNSSAVGELQKRLVAYGLLNAIPNNNFGPLTLAAVKQYQKIKGISQDGNVGPITRASLNADAGNPPVVKSKLDLWIEAGITMEGANPANNNPGNIRYVGQKEAIGHTPNGFCIFPTYAVGYTMMRNLFITAASGGSKLYNPTGSLYDFYNVYAPSSDGNSPRHYAEVVAAHIGVSPSVAINTLI